MCPQELVSGLKKLRRIEETLPNSSALPCTPVFSFALWALLLKLASSCFYHCHKTAIKSQLLSRWTLEMRIFETLAIYVAPDFKNYIYGNIYVYILNSIYIITKHYVTRGLCWFCSDRFICSYKWIHSLQWFNSWLGFGLPSPPCWLFILVIVHREALTQWDFLQRGLCVCVSEWM